MLAKKFKTPINDLRSKTVPFDPDLVVAKKTKLNEIKQKGVSNTLFVYEKNETELLNTWNFLNK